jgi:hypothetical protein
VDGYDGNKFFHHSYFILKKKQGKNDVTFLAHLTQRVM